jgi:uncharacterized glyoxalase superfamily protein PhnB
MATVQANKRIFASLTYENPATATEWLCRAFGFETNFVAKDDEGRPAHVELRFGPDILMLDPARDGQLLKSPRSLPGQSQFICLAVDDVDSHFERARAAGATVDSPPVDTHYGARIYTCRDPEGHVWTIGNYWPQNSRSLKGGD